MEELEAGFKKIEFLRGISQQQVMALMAHISGMGVADNRVSVFEFVRAVTSRELAIQVQRSMVKEVLKSIWLLKPWLMSTLAKWDPASTMKIGGRTFYEALTESLPDMNQQLVERSLPKLTEAQIGSIVEIASGGSREVE